MAGKEDAPAQYRVYEVQQVVTCVVHDHANGLQWDTRRSKLEGHLDHWAVLIQVFKWIQSHILVLFRLVYVFLIFCIFVGISLVQALISHVFEFLSNRASSCMVLALAGCGCRDPRACFQESSRIRTARLLSHSCRLCCTTITVSIQVVNSILSLCYIS